MLRKLIISAIMSIPLILLPSLAEGEVPYFYSPVPQVDFSPVPVIRYESDPQVAPTPTLRQPAPKPVPKPKPRLPVVVRSTGKFLVRGTATWYCLANVSVCRIGYPDTAGLQMYAAASHQLQKALGPHWQGMYVIVTSRTGAHIRVRLIDSCACGGDHRIDLYHDAFVLLSKLSKGNPNPVKVTK